MTDKNEKLLSELEFRMRQLMYLCDSLRDENKQLKALLSEKQHELDVLNTEKDKLNKKLDSLKLANTLVGADAQAQDVEQAKKRLSKLVQEVDKCISLLKL